MKRWKYKEGKLNSMERRIKGTNKKKKKKKGLTKPIQSHKEKEYAAWG